MDEKKLKMPFEAVGGPDNTVTCGPDGCSIAAHRKKENQDHLNKEMVRKDKNK